MQEIKEILKKITGKKHIILTNRCNTAIKLAINLTKKPTTLIQEEGGWILYKKLPKPTTIKCNNNNLDLKDLEKKADSSSVLILNSFSGYVKLENMKKISQICKKNKCEIINDVSGSIGLNESKYGDIIVGSFGRWKPLYLKHGGFIASNQPLKLQLTKEQKFNTSKSKELLKRLKHLSTRWKKLLEITTKIKKHFKIPTNYKSLVAIIPFKTEKQKTEIIKYCKNNKYEYNFN